MKASEANKRVKEIEDVMYSDDEKACALEVQLMTDFITAVSKPEFGNLFQARTVARIVLKSTKLDFARRHG